MNIKQKLQLKFAGIVVLAVFVGLVSYPNVISRIKPIYNLLNAKKINLGLDLQGGVNLEYQADISKVDPSKVTDALQSTQDVVEQRVNAFGIGETLVQTSKTGRVIIQLPGIQNVDDAKNRIGELQNLEFKELGTDPQTQQLFDQIDQLYR